MDATVTIDPGVLAALVRAHVAAGTREHAGVLAGTSVATGRRVACFEPVENAAAAADRFAVNAPDFVAALARAERAGHSWLGFVHGHPGAAAEPSATDHAELWRHCLQLITGEAGGRVEVRAWLWSGRWVETPLQVAAAELP